ncbi:MAG: hypothetical protein NVSMB65_09710 [Chloroflexota bacterium]
MTQGGIRPLQYERPAGNDRAASAPGSAERVTALLHEAGVSLRGSDAGDPHPSEIREIRWGEPAEARR